MGTYKGNVGNLLQHWTLCELLQIANAHAGGLSFIDSHAMAPWATECTRPDQKFESVKNDLPGKGSTYEQAWHSLSQRNQKGGYPNSSAFVREVWKHNYSLILCESDFQTAYEIEEWLPEARESPGCNEAKLFQCDWRERFVSRLPNPSEVGLPTGSLTMVSFDPTIYSSIYSPVSRRTKYLYRVDLGLALYALSGVTSPVVVQLSTYSASGKNPQNKVIESVNSVLMAGQFQQAAVIRVNGSMMSLVYAREVDWADDFAGLPARFAEWQRQTSE